MTVYIEDPAGVAILVFLGVCLLLFIGYVWGFMDSEYRSQLK